MIFGYDTDLHGRRDRRDERHHRARGAPGHNQSESFEAAEKVFI
jgi:hypothetical protein